MKKEGDVENNEINASEATFAYHSVKHNISFRFNDCLSNLIRNLYQHKFTLGRTKAEFIIKNVLAPHMIDELIDDLSK